MQASNVALAAAFVCLSLSLSGCGNETEGTCQYDTTCANTSTSCHCVEVDPAHCQGGQALSDSTQQFHNNTKLWLVYSSDGFAMVSNVLPDHMGWTLCNLNHTRPCSSSLCPSNEPTNRIVLDVFLFVEGTGLMLTLTVIVCIFIGAWKKYDEPDGDQQMKKDLAARRASGMWLYHFAHLLCAVGVALYIQVRVPLCEATACTDERQDMAFAFWVGDMVGSYFPSLKNIVIAQVGLAMVWDLPITICKVFAMIANYIKCDCCAKVFILLWAVSAFLLLHTWGASAIWLVYTPSIIAVAGHHVLAFAAFNFFLTWVKALFKHLFWLQFLRLWKVGSLAPKENKQEASQEDEERDEQMDIMQNSFLYTPVMFLDPDGTLHQADLDEIHKRNLEKHGMTAPLLG